MNRVMNRAIAPLLAALLMLAACGGGGGGGGGAAAPVVVPPTATTLDVTPCFTQMIGNRSVASLVVPDVLTLDLNLPAGFPNGRQPNDPVIDTEIAALFLDLKTVPIDTLAKIPFNPGNDNVAQASFPYLGVAQGGAPAAVGGSGFVFRTNAPSSYTRVDRMGEPAVATILVRSAMKSAFNDDSPANDANGKYVTEFSADLTDLANAFKDDFARMNLKICAVPV